MTLLIGVKSCERDRTQGFHQAIRNTWGSGLTNLYFFMGAGSNPIAIDEVSVDAPDDYRSLPFKTKAMLNWFLLRDWTHMFLCDNDTYINIAEFQKIDYQNYDYSGYFGYWPVGKKMGDTFRYDDGQGNIHDPCHAWASGGFGYFVSRKAAELIVATEPCSWAEDLWVGQALGPHIQSGAIKGHALQNYAGTSVWHIAKGPGNPFTAQRIRDYHNGVRP
jgi:hypothetical protein